MAEKLYIVDSYKGMPQRMPFRMFAPGIYHEIDGMLNSGDSDSTEIVVETLSPTPFMIGKKMVGGEVMLRKSPKRKETFPGRPLSNLPIGGLALGKRLHVMNLDTTDGKRPQLLLNLIMEPQIIVEGDESFISIDRAGLRELEVFTAQPYEIEEYSFLPENYIYRSDH